MYAHQMDVASAYAEEELSYWIVYEPPELLNENNEKNVQTLETNLGIKQADRELYKTLNLHLVSHGG